MAFHTIKFAKLGLTSILLTMWPLASAILSANFSALSCCIYPKEK